jgi:A nuclease of the HNH/ENDO VII superfamily with conserved WHH
MTMATTRSQKKKRDTAAKQQKVNPVNELPEGAKRDRKPTDHSSHPPKVVDQGGNKVLLPGNSATSSKRMKLSGDSRKDIKKLVKDTGQGGPNSGQTWHHMADYDTKTGHGTVKLMPTNIHAGNPHTGGSAQARAHKFDDPDRKAKLNVN